MGLFSFFSNKKSETPQVFSNNKAEDGNQFLGSFSRGWGQTPTPDYDLSSPYVDNTRRGYNYVRFGEDNLYPYHLLEMYNGSSMHSSCVKFLTDILIANGVKIDNPKAKTLEEKIRLENIRSIFDDDFVERFIQEYLIHGRVCLIVNGKQDGDKFKVSNLKLVGAEQVRVAADKEGYYFSKDWRVGVKDLFIDKFDKLNPKDGTMICLQKLGPGQYFYPVPQYTSAANWIWLDSEIAYFQKQNIVNSVNPSAILTLYEKFHNPEEKEKFIYNFKRSFAGARNGGKVMVFNAKDPETAPKFDMMESNKLDESFVGVNDAIVENIARAHQISPVIMGVSTAGKLGATSEIQDAYSIFHNGKLRTLSRLINKQLNELVDLFDANVTLVLEPAKSIVNNANNDK